MITLTETRKEARNSLKEKWGKAAVITLLYVIIEFVISALTSVTKDNSIINLIIQIVELIISVPLAYGLTVSFIKLKRNEEIQEFDFVKIAVNEFKNAWLIELYTIVKLLIPLIIVILGIAVCVILYFANVMVFAGMSDILKVFIAFLFSGVIIVLIAYYYSKVLEYVASIYLSYNDKNLKPSEAVNESPKMMVGHRGMYFLLHLSFIGWGILSVFTLGIGTLFLSPYIKVAQICFFDKILEEKELKKEIKSEE